MKLGRIKTRVIGLLFALIRRDPYTKAKISARQDLIELGTKYGGWVIPATLFDKDSTCYCVGCGEDISFDLALKERFGCAVFGFDPTPRAIKFVNDLTGEDSRYHFYDFGLWDREEVLKFFTPQQKEHVSHSLVNLQKTDEFIEVPVKRLSKIMGDLAHTHLDLLKLDIEGAEYRVIQSIVDDGLNIRVICVEYDESGHHLDANYKQRISDSIELLLSAGYSIVCNQGNGNYTFVKDSK